MKKSKYSLLLILTLVLSVFLAACGGGNSADKGDKKSDGAKTSNVAQEIKVLSRSEIPTLDSVKTTDEIGFNVLNSINEGLYTADKDGSSVPALVDGEPKVSEDGKTVTFKLVDAKWSNGDPVTANDFVYAWQRAIDPATASEYGPYMMNGKIAGAQEITDAAVAKKEFDLNTLGIKALDEKTLEVKFEKVLPYWKDLMAFPTFYPQNEKFVKEKGDAYASNAENLLSNGAFKITSWNGPTATEWTLEKNDNYREAKAVTLKKITFNVVKDNNAQVNAFEGGEADITDILASDLVPQYQGDERMVSSLQPSVFWVKMNYKNAALANVHIREAIAKAFNKEDIAASILNNGSIAANYFVPKQFVSTPDGKDFREKNGDLIVFNAKEAKAAWEKGLADLGIDKLELRYLGGDTDSAKKVDEYIKNQLETNLPGLKVNLESVPFAIRLDRAKAGNYDLLHSGWGPDYPDAMTFADLWLTDGPNNEMSYSSAKYDGLIKKAEEVAANQEEYVSTLQEAERVFLAEDYGVAPTYQKADNILINTKVKGLVALPFGPNYSYKWITVEE
ncbi:peptide ABC transporter substrate-binding protein [Bacillus cihuensis]|uniref:peptide ABC transporter substrate-binding protein n=1 Tax=Bacillus cihuensis TaxID=1208599 RepID=UPI000421BD06|nr:peptide ABC transporter substrate-binding protein [Bacillus cihuensis]